MARSTRNRKRTQQKATLGPIAAPIIVIATMVVVIIGLNSRYQALGGEVTQLEQERRELLQALGRAESRWARMLFPHRIEAALTRHRIDMIWPDDRLIVRLSEDEVFGAVFDRSLMRGEVASLSRGR
ncbi:MAG: hypothetical protein ACI9OU_000667 [Candidatus Promineifilaceae bacterium]|jgi:hypothetical protein